MSSHLPTASIPFICNLREAREARKRAVGQVEELLGRDHRDAFVRLDTSLNEERYARERLFAFLLAAGVKRKAAKRVAFDD